MVFAWVLQLPVPQPNVQFVHLAVWVQLLVLPRRLQLLLHAAHVRQTLLLRTELLSLDELLPQLLPHDELLLAGLSELLLLGAGLFLLEAMNSSVRPTAADSKH